MTLVKQTDLSWAYPVLGFPRDDYIRYFDYLLPLVEFPQWVFKDSVLLGMELIDSAGEQWFVRTVDRISPEHPSRRWWQIWPFWEEPRDVLELGLEKGGRVTFEAVREKVCAMYEASMHPEGDDLRYLDEETLDELRKADSFEAMGELTGSLDAIGYLD